MSIKFGKTDLTAPPAFEAMNNDPFFPPERKNSKGNYKRVLTTTNHKRIVKLVKLISRKDHNKMSNENSKTAKSAKTSKTNAVKSIAWLVEAGWRGFVGWVLLSSFDSRLTVVAAVYALLTAGIIVITHFMRANSR